jgi:hypothetical protein
MSSADGTGRGRSVQSTAMIAAPASARPSTSSKNGVIRTGLSSRSRLTMPTTGSEQAFVTAPTLATPSMRTPAAPTLSAIRA